MDFEKAKKRKPSRFSRFFYSSLPQLPTKKVHLELNPVGIFSGGGQVGLTPEFIQIWLSRSSPPSAPYLEATATREGLNGSYRDISPRERERWRQVLTLVTSPLFPTLRCIGTRSSVVHLVLWYIETVGGRDRSNEHILIHCAPLPYPALLAISC